MVPQKRYKPHTSSDRRRYVEEVQLEPSIYFYMSKPDESGIPLKAALRCRFARLVGRDEPMFKGRGPSLSMRLNVSLTPHSFALYHLSKTSVSDAVRNQWPGYRPWTRQISTRDFRNPPGPITRSKLVKKVAKSVARFIAVSDISSHRDNHLTGSFQEHQGCPMEDDREPIWAVGARKIEVNDLVLVRFDHVSENSWQAQFQLLRPLYRS